MTHKDYAYRYMPLVYQDVKERYDWIQPVYYGKFVEELPPTVYFEVIDHGYFLMIVWCVFHRYDWSDCPILPIKRADSHDLDFEGWIKIVNKDDERVLWGATRAHKELKFHVGDFNEVSIEPEGHGIYPGIDTKHIDLSRVKMYQRDDFIYQNMKGAEFSKHIRPVLFRDGKVTDWRDWNDYHIKRKVRGSDLFITENPMALFNAAKELGLV